MWDRPFRCAIKALGGTLLGQLHPTDHDQRRRALDAGHDLNHILDHDDLVAGDNTFFVATGVTDGILAGGVRRSHGIIHTDSIALRSRSGTLRRIQADHRADKWF